MRWLARLLTGALALAMLPAVGPGPTAFAASPFDPSPSDPTAVYPVKTVTYDLGTKAFRVQGFPGPIELQGVVHYPAAPKGKKLPVVFFLHGRHVTCGKADGAVELRWPCPSGFRPIPSYRGFDYLGKGLAARGYIVVSISANGINAMDQEVDDSGARARALLLQKHLDLWSTWTTKGTGPFGAGFLGAIDFQRVGTMGHSRGGEGVVAQLPINRAASKPYGIKAVLPLAPTDFDRRLAIGVPLGVVLPTCDGDLFDLQGVHFYDDVRYASTGDRAPKHVATISGANHNYFNTMWSPSSKQPDAADDWSWTDHKGGRCEPGRPGRLTESQQRNIAATYVGGFFQLYLGGNRGFEGYWHGEKPAPQPYGRVAVSYHAPPADRRDVNRLVGTGDLTRNTLGGAVERRGFSRVAYCGGPAPQPGECLDGEYDGHTFLQPHASGEWGTKPGMPILETTWIERGAVFSNELPEGQRSLLAYDALRFRATWDFSDVKNSTDPHKIRIRLVDSRGRWAEVDPARYGIALDYPEEIAHCALCVAKPVRRYHLQQVRVPLSAFDGIDLNDVRWIRFVYSGAAKGSLGLTDLALTR